MVSSHVFPALSVEVLRTSPTFISENSSVVPSKASYSPPATNETPSPNLISSSPVLVLYAGFLTQRTVKSPRYHTENRCIDTPIGPSWTIRSVLVGPRMRMHALVLTSELSLTFQVPTMSFAQGQMFRCSAMRSLSEAWPKLCV